MRQAVLALALLLSVARCAPAPDPAPAERASDETSGNAPIVSSAENLKWMDLDPNGAPGVKIAGLWGNPATGRFGAFLKLPAGFAAPLHTHTHPMKVVMVSVYLHPGPGRSGRVPSWPRVLPHATGRGLSTHHELRPSRGLRHLC
jgi:hypothetical protein